jgi:hypothetical protein
MRIFFWLPQQPPRAPGKHSIHWPQHRIKELEQLLAERPNLIQVHCSASKAAHPVWWTDEAPGGCPWCQAELLASENVGLRLELDLMRPPAPAGEPLVAALAEDPRSCFAGMDHDVPSAFVEPLIHEPAPVAAPPYEPANVWAETEATDVSALRAAAALDPGDTAKLAVVAPVPPVPPHPPAIATTADHLEPAHAKRPPEMPVHLVEQQLVTWNPFRDRDTEPDPLAGDDLKALVSPSSLPGTTCWQTVSLTKAG